MNAAGTTARWEPIRRTSDENAGLRVLVGTARDFDTRDIGDRRR
ncbi:hypothetical protein [Streptomyces sp. MH13]